MISLAQRGRLAIKGTAVHQMVRIGECTGVKGRTWHEATASTVEAAKRRKKLQRAARKKNR